MITLRRKILLGYAVAVSLAGIVLAMSLLHILRLGNASDAILQENYRSILAAEEMLNAIARQENAAMQMVIGIDPNAITQFSEAEQQFLSWLGKAKENVTIGGEPAILHRIESRYREFLYSLAHFRSTHEGNREAGLQFYRQELAPQAEEVREACRELHDLNRRTMEGSSRDAQRLAEKAVWSMAAVGVMILGAAVVASAWLSNRIVRPVLSLTQATERVAAGDYDVVIEPESRDEIGQLAEKFKVMLAELRSYNELRLRRIVGEQRKAEAILDAIDDGVLMISTAGEITSVNPAAARALEIQGGSVEGRGFSEVVRDDRLNKLIAETLDLGTAPPPDQTEDYISRAGTEDRESHFQYTLTPIAAPEGGLLGLIVLLRNVTALKQLDELKTEFVMTASHELRSPLTSISMSIELLRERAPDVLEAKDRQLLDIAHEELERLQSLVEELLDLSKIESGKLEMEMMEASVSNILEAAVAPFRVQAAERSIELALNIPAGLVPVRADPTKLAWVVTNLVGNALRYARSKINVSAEQAGRWMNIYVLDDGEGIPHEEQARIFEKFVQISDVKRKGGAGLGLAISKEIVKAHRGHIWVESEPGEGSLFIIMLPVAKMRKESK